MTDINKTVREKIKSLRLEANLTQEELAHEASIHRAYLGQIERGKKNIGLTNLEKLSKALNVDIKTFFD